MEEKDYISNKVDLYNLKKTYTQQSEEPKGFFQKLGKKMTSWYVNPFGDSQNKFNNTVVDSFEDTSECLNDLTKQIQTLETKLSAVVQQNEALKTRINKFQQATQQNDVAIIDSCINSINRTSKEMNDYIRMVNPDMRKGVSPYYREINELLSIQLSNTISKSTNDNTLNDWAKNYKTTLKQELKGMAIANANNIIAVICTGFLTSDGLDTVRTEAFNLFRVLKKSSVYNMKFVSIEPLLQKPVFQGDILCIPEKGSQQYIEVINPKLCIFCGSTPAVMCMDNNSMLLNKSIVRLSGQNPLYGIDEDTIKELVRLNDLGIHKYLVQSQKAYDILVENGFHEPIISYPTVNLKRVFPRGKTFNKDTVTIGFTSSPIQESEFSNRGIELLSQVANAMPKVNFEILWKYETVDIPESLKSLKNCNIINGECNMKDFYNKIDCLLVPYTTTENNAISLSSLEAVKNGIPVVCTEVCGIAELINAYIVGEVAPITCDGLVNAIEKVIANYEVYTNPVNRKSFELRVDTSNLVDTIEKEAEKPLQSKPVTINQWEKLLGEGKTPIIEPDKVKEYYKNNSVDNKYLESKYTVDALKCINFIECQNIGIILEDRFEDSKAKILNVTYGDKHISDECSKYGTCTSVDILSEPVEDVYNVITCFRYLNHLDYATRKSIYKQFNEHLSDNGMLLMDVPNMDFELYLMGKNGWKNTNLYEVSWSKDNIIKELKDNGFSIQYIIPLGQNLMPNLPDNIKNRPMLWTIGALKNDII